VYERTKVGKGFTSPLPAVAQDARMTKRRSAARIALGVVALFVLIQFIPYGHSHANPRVTRAVKWDSPRTQQLFQGACQDCHSNLSHWRWYDKFAPGSWLVQNDIQGGRDNLNFSEWDKPQPDVGEVIAAIESGSMPPIQYKVAHAAARLSKTERARLEAGIRATYSADPPGGG
jgi:mono/diheme cytochrome c family protein